MHLNKFDMYRAVPGGICLQGEPFSLRLEFVADNIFRMWTTLQDDFRQEETLVVERTFFDCPNLRNGAGRSGDDFRPTAQGLCPS